MNRWSSAPSLEEELIGLLHAARLSERQVRAVSRRLGWDGNGGTTLASAGAPEGYSRERVRQLESRVRQHLAAAPGAVPAIQAAVGRLERVAPAGRTDGAVALAAAGLSAAPFDPAGVLVAAEAAGLPAGVRIQRGILVRADHDQVAPAARSVARRIVFGHGAVRVETVRIRLGADAPDLQQLRRLLELGAGALWLDEERDWLTLPRQRTRLDTIVRKMLAVAPLLSIEDLAEGLRRSSRPVVLPLWVLRSLLRTREWLDVAETGDTASARVALDEALYLTPLERLLVGVFRTSGPVLSHGRAVKLAALAGANPNSAGVYLCKSPVLRGVARGRYTLRGHDAGVVRLRPSRRDERPVYEGARAW